MFISSGGCAAQWRWDPRWYLVTASSSHHTWYPALVVVRGPWLVQGVAMEPLLPRPWWIQKRRRWAVACQRASLATTACPGEAWCIPKNGIDGGPGPFFCVFKPIFTEGHYDHLKKKGLIRTSTWSRTCCLSKETKYGHLQKCFTW